MRDIKGVLIDLDGVVHQRGAAIPGSIEVDTGKVQALAPQGFAAESVRQHRPIVWGE